MKLIILWQSKKDLTQVIIQMNDIGERKLFHSLENKLKKWLYVATFALFVSTILNITTHNTKNIDY